LSRFAPENCVYRQGNLRKISARGSQLLSDKKFMKNNRETNFQTSGVRLMIYAAAMLPVMIFVNKY
jgi:hypothetical protein